MKNKDIKKNSFELFITKFRAMKKRIPLYFFLFILNIATLQAQGIIEHFNGFKSDFIITSKDSDLSPLDQVLVKRASLKLETAAEAAFGLGYEAIHLEFIASKKLGTARRQADHRWIDKFYAFKLFGENNTMLAEIRLGRESVREYPLEEIEGYYAYSVELRYIPLVLLEKTKRIDITFIMLSNRFR